MPNRTRDVPGYIYRGQDDHDGMVCRIIGKVIDPDILADVGPCYQIEFDDGLVQTMVPAAFLTPWFPSS